MSDSLNGTVIVSVFVLTISAKLELEDELSDPVDSDPPRLPAVVAPLVELVELLESEDELVDEPEDDPALTDSPAEVSASDAIDPLTGARRIVSSTASSSLLTVCSSLSTVSLSEAIVVAETVVLVLDEVVELESPLLLPLLSEGVELDVVVVVSVLGRDLKGAVTVFVVVVVIVVVSATSSETKSVLDGSTCSSVSALVPSLEDPVDEEPPVEPVVAMPSSASVYAVSASSRLIFAWASVSSAEVGSSVARIWPLVTCSPTWTSTSLSVPLVAKSTSSTTPASTLPLPLAVVWTTPHSEPTVSVSVRAELVAVPSWEIARMATTTAAAPSTYRCTECRNERRWKGLFIDPPLSRAGAEHPSAT
jgi:hypothetical protein